MAEEGIEKKLQKKSKTDGQGKSDGGTASSSVVMEKKNITKPSGPSLGKGGKAAAGACAQQSKKKPPK